MNWDIWLLLIGAGIGFFINLAAVLLEVGLKSWAEHGNKKHIIEKNLGNVKISTTPEIMKLLSPGHKEGKEFIEERVQKDNGTITGFDWKLLQKFLSSMVFWAFVVYLVARNWYF